MENNRAHEIMVEVLQKALAGKLCSGINLHDIANAIAAKVQFEKSYTNTKKDKVAGQIIDAIVEKQDEIKTATDLLGSEPPVLLKNFINGKRTAYLEILAIINTL